MVLNENLHEFDELEKHLLKDKIKSFFGDLLIFIIFLLLLGGVIICIK